MRQYRQYSAAARTRLTEPWEECVLYPYDDKVPKRHIDGVFRYPEYDFEHPPIGTISIGFGHTDAAGNLKITKDMRLTREEAGELESKDLAPGVAWVNEKLRVDVSQHQFDALVDTWFNCPKAALAAIQLINAGHPEQVPAKLLQYTYSRGEHMDGLTHRRQAEITWFNHPDDAPAPAPVPEPHPDIVFCPKGERNPAPKTVLSSSTGAAGFSIGTLSLAGAAKSLNDLMDPVRQVRGSLDELGLGDMLAMATHDPKVMACIVVAGFASFIIWDRHQRLVNDHV
jgi:GH24 family phage-related lysozyme (muramidase)